MQNLSQLFMDKTSYVSYLYLNQMISGGDMIGSSDDNNNSTTLRNDGMISITILYPRTLRQRICISDKRIYPTRSRSFKNLNTLIVRSQ